MTNATARCLTAATLLLAPGVGYGQDATPAEASPFTGTSFLDNGIVRVGVDLDLGGAITWVSKAGGGKNVVNGHDYGRQIQMSYYAGPVPYTPDGKEPAPTWAGLGWNPIQTGDCFGNTSRVTAHANDGTTLTVACIPMHWPLDNEPGHCTFETRIELEGSTVRVRCTLRNARRDPTQYPAREQEMPAVYTNGFLHRLVTYAGPRPFEDDALTTIEKRWSSAADLAGGSPWATWQATEGWAALLDDDGWGLGICVPGPLRFTGGFFGTPGAGGPKDPATGYMSPIRREVLDAAIEHAYTYTLVLGTKDEIRAAAVALHRPWPLPHYRFEDDRAGWSFAGCRDRGWPIEGALHVRLDGPDPQLLGPPALWRAEDVPHLFLEAAFATGEDRATLFWSKHGGGGFTAEQAVVFPVSGAGDYRVYDIELAGRPGYDGVLDRLRLDPAAEGGEGREVHVRSLSAHDPRTTPGGERR